MLASAFVLQYLKLMADKRILAILLLCFITLSIIFTRSTITHVLQVQDRHQVTHAQVRSHAFVSEKIKQVRQQDAYPANAHKTKYDQVRILWFLAFATRYPKSTEKGDIWPYGVRNL